MIRLKGTDLKRASVNSLSPLGAQNKNLGNASPKLLAGVKLHLQPARGRRESMLFCKQTNSLHRIITGFSSLLSN